MVQSPAATAAVNSRRSFPDALASASNAALNSRQRSVKRPLSLLGEPPRMPGYSQSRSKPSKPNFLRVSIDDLDEDSSFLFLWPPSWRMGLSFSSWVHPPTAIWVLSLGFDFFERVYPYVQVMVVLFIYFQCVRGATDLCKGKEARGYKEKGRCLQARTCLLWVGIGTS